MIALVTGGTGFIGKKLVDALSRLDYRVRVISRRKFNEETKFVEVVEGDLLSESFPFAEALKDCALVFNCAGEIRDENKMTLLHVNATERLIQAAIQETKRVKKNIHWIQLSSVGAYGPNYEGASVKRIVTEETPVNPFGTYEESKVKSDELVENASSNPFFTYSILRPSNVFGVDMPNNSLRELGKVINKGLFFYIGKSNSIAPYVHVEDVVKALLLCATDAKARGEIFNISNDCFLEDMIGAIAKAYNRPAPAIRIPEKFLRFLICCVGSVIRLPLSVDRINALVSRTSYPNDKLERLLGFSPEISVVSSVGEVARTEK